MLRSQDLVVERQGGQPPIQYTLYNDLTAGLGPYQDIPLDRVVDVSQPLRETGPVTYRRWTFPQVPAGNYVVLAQDLTGQISIVPYQVIPDLELTQSQVRAERWSGEQNGAINLWLTGGRTPYQVTLTLGSEELNFRWTNQEPTWIEPLRSGPWQVVIYDGLTRIEEQIIVPPGPPRPTILNWQVVESESRLDLGDGLIRANIAFFSRPVTAWLQPVGIEERVLTRYAHPSQEPLIFSPVPANTYYLWVTDGETTLTSRDLDNGWLTVLPGPSPLEITPDIWEPSYFQGTGGVVLKVSSGTPPFKIEIALAPASFRQTSYPMFEQELNVTRLAPGEYEFIVTDSSRRPQQERVFVTIPRYNLPPLDIELQSVQNPTRASQDNGIVTARAEGGFGQYTFVLIGLSEDDIYRRQTIVGQPQNHGHFENLIPGQYRIRVVDEAEQSTISPRFDIQAYQPRGINVLGFDIQAETQWGLNDGQITITATSSDGTLEYELVNERGKLVAQQNSNVLSNLAPGHYSLEINDGINVRQLIPDLFIEPAELPSLSVLDIDLVTINDDNTSQWQIIATGLVSPTIIQVTTLDQPDIIIQELVDELVIADLLPGQIYQIKITDAGGREIIRTIDTNNIDGQQPIIYHRTIIAGSIIDPGGRVNLIGVTGGRPPYNLSLSGIDVDYNSVQTGDRFNWSELTPGRYQLTIEDQNNERVGEEIILPPIDQFLVLEDWQVTEITGPNRQDAQVSWQFNLPVIMTYGLAGGEKMETSASMITDLGPGVYDFRARTNNGLYWAISFGISDFEVDPLRVVNTDIQPPSTWSADDACINWQFLGGYTPFKWELVNLETGSVRTSVQPEICNLMAGRYTWQLSDSAGQTIKGEIVIPRNGHPQNISPSQLTWQNLTLTPPSRFDQRDGSLTVIGVTAGEGNLSYRLQGTTYSSEWQTSTEFNNLTPGDYTLYVRDRANEINFEFQVAARASQNLTWLSLDVGMASDTTTQDGFIISPAQGELPLSYELYSMEGELFGQQSTLNQTEPARFNNLPAGIYKLKVTDDLNRTLERELIINALRECQLRTTQELRFEPPINLDQNGSLTWVVNSNCDREVRYQIFIIRDDIRELYWGPETSLNSVALPAGRMYRVQAFDTHNLTLEQELFLPWAVTPGNLNIQINDNNLSFNLIGVAPVVVSLITSDSGELVRRETYTTLPPVIRETWSDISPGQYSLIYRDDFNGELNYSNLIIE